MIRPMVVATGAPVRENGVDLFLEIAAQILPEVEVRFLWAGGRTQRARLLLDAEATRLRVHRWIEWSDEALPTDTRDAIALVTARTVDGVAAQLAAAENAGAIVAFHVGDRPRLQHDRAPGTRYVRYPDVRAVAAEVRSLLSVAR